MKFPISDEALAQHIAILGKTGAGKSSIAKGAVEHLVAQGARVCVLDPIKSDWWGLTSSADGKKAGLPFQILGGPRGHVPLHPTSGKVIAELVADGSLPLCILDMADFPPGGMAQFFNDFAPTLLRKMKGVVHLVLEEAHEFAPKERSGIGAENMLIHHAKKLATAGRSKGIRLVLATQRIQALHNALLGSCDTMVALRLTAPADQKPVVDWLKSNLAKDQAAQVAGSLARLKTGQGWVCSSGSEDTPLVQFPRIKTYDNSATPEAGAIAADDVRTAPVDVGKLRELVGAAVAEADANDPVKLRAEIARLTRQVAEAVKIPPGFEESNLQCARDLAADEVRAGIPAMLDAQHGHSFKLGVVSGAQAIVDMVRATALPPLVHPPARVPIPETFVMPGPRPGTGSLSLKPAPKPAMGARFDIIAPERAREQIGMMSPTTRKILDAVHATYPASLSFAAAATRVGVSNKSSAYGKYRKEAFGSGEVDVDGDRMTSKPGFAAPVQDMGNPVDTWAARLPPSMGKMLRAVAMGFSTRDMIGRDAGVSLTSSGLDGGLKELVRLELIRKQGDQYFLHQNMRT